VIRNLARKLSSVNYHDFKSYCHKPDKNSFFVTPTNSIELTKIITKLNNTKSPGYDNIGPRLIKGVCTTILDPLVHIFNLSLLSGCVPHKLKVAKVIPVFKKGDHFPPTNYRP